MEYITVTLEMGMTKLPVSVPVGSDLGHIRTLKDNLETIGAPSAFNLAVNGVAQEETYVLNANDNVQFRPVSASKG